VICAIMLAGFVILARPSPSVLRAAVMGSVALLGLLLGRRTSALPALSVAVIGLVVVDPFLARSIGFVLSVVATAGLVTIAPGWTRRLEHRVPHPVAVAVAVPAAAQVACTPVLLLAFGQLTPYAVPANLLAGLAVVPATVLGVACAGVASVAAPAGTVVAWLGAVPTAWIAQVARGFSWLPAAGLTASPGVGVTLAILLAALGIGWLALSRRRDILAAWHR
jgi:competence protein ComEC